MTHLSNPTTIAIMVFYSFLTFSRTIDYTSIMNDHPDHCRIFTWIHSKCFLMDENW